MKLIKQVAILASAIALSSPVFADDMGAAASMDAKSKEVKEFRGFVKHGMSSQMGGKMVHDMDLSEEQLAALELGMAEIHNNMPAEGDVTMEEGIEAGVAAHLAAQELFDSILTDEQKAARDAKKAEREAKKAERDAKRAEREAKPELTDEEKAAKKAEWEAKKADRDAKKGEREAKPELTEEEKAAKKAEWEAKKAEREAAREAKKAEREAKSELTDEEKAAKKAEWEAKKAEREAAREAKKAEREAKKAAAEA